jgi:glycosyltransferase involved in cell wall biosynthesis
MYNICILTPEFPIGGTGNYVYQLALNLTKLFKDDYHVHIITKGFSEYEKWINDNICVYFIKGSLYNITYDPIFFAKVRMKISNFSRQLDIIHVNSPLINDFAIPNSLSIPIITTIHTTLAGEEKSASYDISYLTRNEKILLSLTILLKMLEKRLYERSSRLIAVSEFIKKEVISKYSIQEDKIKVIYNGVDTNFFRPINDAKNILEKFFQIPKEKKIILYLGRFTARKGITLLVRSIPLINHALGEHHRDVVFVFAGFNKNSQIFHLIEDAKRYGNVIFLGRVNRFLLPILYSASYIYVLPSFYEGFPFSILEAQSCSLPVVASNAGGIPEAVEHLRTGIIFPTGNVRKLVDAIVYLVQNERLRNNFGVNARKFVEGSFSWRKIIYQVDNMYKSILGG